jgi:vacuolar-type H+-ATPase subunit I/STV1
MHEKRSHLILPSLLFGLSILGLALCAMLTNPFSNVENIIFFFADLVVLLISLGYLIAYIGRGSVSPKARYRIILVSLTVVLILMLGSAQSLNLQDLFILVLIACGALFYSSKRVV